MTEERLPLTLLELYKKTFISSISCLEEIGRKLLAYSKRTEKKLSVVVFDINNLRSINKDYGYDKGNDLLLILADSIDCSLRKSDIAGKYEGGSFLVILPDTDVAGSLKVEERIRKTFETKLKDSFFKDKNISYTAAIAAYPEHGDSFEDILHNLKSCIESHKKDKKSNIVVCNVTKKKKLHITITDLVQAMKEDRLFPVFQKIIDFENDKVYGYEVLMRLKTITGEIVPASAFIDLVYSSNMIYAFEEYVIDKAISKIKSIEDPKPKLFINMPLRIVKIFRKDKQQIKKLLEDIVDSQSIVFEISERKEKEPLESLGYLAKELRNFGFSIALDDFGVESASFQKLSIVKPDIVKLDRFFLMEGKDMLKWVSDGLKSMGYKILVEGVEKEEDLELVKRVKPDFVQGFYYGKPSEDI